MHPLSLFESLSAEGRPHDAVAQQLTRCLQRELVRLHSPIHKISCEPFGWSPQAKFQGAEGGWPSARKASNATTMSTPRTTGQAPPSALAPEHWDLFPQTVVPATVPESAHGLTSSNSLYLSKTCNQRPASHYDVRASIN